MVEFAAGAETDDFLAEPGFQPVEELAGFFQLDAGVGEKVLDLLTKDFSSLSLNTIMITGIASFLDSSETLVIHLVFRSSSTFVANRFSCPFIA